MPIVTKEDREQFNENGYVKLDGIVPEENCEALVDAIYEFTGRDPADPETWYQPPEGLDEPFSSSGMIELYHHQAMWDNRQHPDVYQAFAELLGEEALHVSIDRVNMTPPRHPDHLEFDNAFIHWDVDTAPLPDRPVQPEGTPAVPFGVQGVIYLDDTSEEQGGFQCVPSLYRNLDEWVADQPEDRDTWNPDFDEEGYPIEPIPGETGDLVIWDRLLPHGNGHNEAETPRFAQYVLTTPASYDEPQRRRDRIRSWRRNEAPPEEYVTGDPREQEKEHPRAELTALGERLLGLDFWPNWRG